MSARDDIVELDAHWLEQRQCWLTVALHHAQKARKRGERCAPFSIEGALACREHLQHMGRAMQLREEIRVAGFKVDPLLEEAYYAERTA